MTSGSERNGDVDLDFILCFKRHTCSLTLWTIAVFHDSKDSSVVLVLSAICCIQVSNAVNISFFALVKFIVLGSL